MCSTLKQSWTPSCVQHQIIAGRHHVLNTESRLDDIISSIKLNSNKITFKKEATKKEVKLTSKIVN